LEGRRVSVSFTNGSQLENVQVVSAGCGGLSSCWLEASGVDVFIDKADVVDVKLVDARAA
jgi:hypothetical protein